jgi:hypothetical protein
MPFKIATWNVELPVASRRREALRYYTDREQADLWVLTETYDGFTPGHEFSHSSASGRDGFHKREHRWVSIWSRFPVEPLETSDEVRTAAVRVHPESVPPFIVFGTVLPWIGSQWRGHASAGGVAFREALSVQCADWIQIRNDYPEDEVFLLGDFNQDLVATSPRYYGSRSNRAALEGALESAGLACLTAGLGDPVRRDSPPYACIDHICSRRDSHWRDGITSRWPDTPKPQRSISDHFGIAITFAEIQNAPEPMAESIQANLAVSQFL